MRAGALAIISDDLTGALDAAAPFSGGARVVVATRPEAVGRAFASGASVVSVSTRSREIASEDAHDRVSRVLAELPAGVARFKKVDSRLQGHISAELSAFDGPFLVMPAIPEFGRIVRRGMLSGFGIERPVDVAGVIGHADISVPDAASQADMVGAVSQADEDAVLVGARGLAQALAQVWGYGPPKRPEWSLPSCFAIGSTDPITLEQIGELRARCAGLTHVAAPNGLAPAPGRTSPVTLVQATPGPAARPDDVARAFAKTAQPYLRAARTVVLSGGATAEAMLDALGVDVLTVEGEALPGMPLSRAGGQAIVTKSGGFGDAGALAFLAGMALSGAQGEISEEAGVGTGR